MQPERLEENAAILARAEYLDGPAPLIERAISDRITLTAGADPLHIPDFMFQHREAANFPWVSQAAWLYAQMVRAGHAVHNTDDYAAAQTVLDRKRVVKGKSVSVRVDLGGRSIIKNKKTKEQNKTNKTT